MAASREVLVFSSWGLDDGDQGNTVSLPRPPGSQHPGHCRSKCDVASSAIAVTPEQSCPPLETVAGGDRARAAGCGLGGEEVTEQGARQGSGADPSGRVGRSSASWASRWTPGLRSFVLGYHGCSGCYQCKGLFYFSLIPLSCTVTTLQTATRTAGLLCTRHPSPEGGEKPASLSHGAASCRGHAAGVGPRGPPPGVPVPEALGGDRCFVPPSELGGQVPRGREGLGLVLAAFHGVSEEEEDTPHGKRGQMGSPDSGRV